MIVFHDNNGHLGVEKTRDLIQRKYWWPSMRKDIREYVDSCHTCQTINARTTRNEGCLIPRDIPTEPNTVMSLDHMGPLNEKEDHILVCIDNATRYMDAVTVPSTSSTHYLDFMTNRWIPRFGVPSVIIMGQAKGIREHENQPIPSQTGNCSSELPTVLATIKRTDRANGRNLETGATQNAKQQGQMAEGTTPSNASNQRHKASSQWPQTISTHARLRPKTARRAQPRLSRGRHRRVS
ncbi:hypothetical protein MRX96_026096 [Rhipicephalus microplus]